MRVQYLSTPKAGGPQIMSQSHGSIRQLHSAHVLTAGISRSAQQMSSLHDHIPRVRRVERFYAHSMFILV